MNQEIERRFFPISEIRIENRKGAPVLVGTAAVFNKYSVNLGGFREIIEPGFFRYALAQSDCDARALFNHEPSMILGRMSAGTCRISENDEGLPFEVDLADRSYDRDLQISMKRGDVRECSFGFRTRDGGDKWEQDLETKAWTRTLKADGCEKLYDVSPVTYPAYPDTSCAMRSLNKAMGGFRTPVDDMYFRKLRLDLEAVL